MKTDRIYVQQQVSNLIDGTKSFQT
jgi:hypothetical protein